MNHLVIVVALLLGLSGCGGRSGTPSGAGPSWAKGTVDGVSYEVRGQGDSKSVVVVGSREFTAGKNTLGIQGGRVSANGKDFGSVKPGDSVLLDEDGTVTINGEKR